VRVLADTLLLFYFALNEMKCSIKDAIDWKLSLVVALVAISFAGLLVPVNLVRVLIWVVSVVGGYTLCWYMLFSPHDRTALLKRVGYASD
jgi:hypothetical protein